jgi:hypothetical protein
MTRHLSFPRPSRLSVTFGSLLLVALLLSGPPAVADSHCSFDANPSSSQFRGLDVGVKGSFTNFANQEVRAILVTSWGAFGPQGVILEPPGMTNGSGDFDFAATIPPDHPTGSFDLTVLGTAGFLDYRWCDKPYTVMQFFLIPVTIVTTTTLGLAPPPTIPATTTTAPPPTTTEAPTTTVEDSTTTEAPTTTEEVTTTTADDLLAGAEVGGQGIPGWLILLVAVLAGAVLGLVGYLLGQRRREQVAGPGQEVPPPPAAE